MEMLIRIVKKAKGNTEEKQLSIAETAQDIYNRIIAAAASCRASLALNTSCQSPRFSALCSNCALILKFYFQSYLLCRGCLLPGIPCLFNHNTPGNSKLSLLCHTEQLRKLREREAR